MTNSELKKKIAEAPDIEWFKNVNETFNFQYVNFIQSLTGVSTIYEFVNQQISGWEKFENSMPSEFILSKTYFVNIRNQIIQFVNSYFNQPGNTLNNYWQSVRNPINNLNQKPLPYNSPQTEFLFKVHKETPNYYPGAYQFILGTNNYNLNNRENFYGAILAYEFTLKDYSELTERRKAEQNSFSKIRKDFQKYLTESESQIIDHLKNTNKNYQEYVKKIDDLKLEKENLFKDWFDKTKNDVWEKWYNERLEVLKKLEHTYEAKLKLEKPARYWERKSTNYYSQATTARNLLIGIIIVSATFLGLILVFSPDWIFKWISRIILTPLNPELFY